MIDKRDVRAAANDAFLVGIAVGSNVLDRPVGAFAVEKILSDAFGETSEHSTRPLMVRVALPEPRALIGTVNGYDAYVKVALPEYAEYDVGRYLYWMGANGLEFHGILDLETRIVHPTIEAFVAYVAERNIKFLEPFSELTLHVTVEDYDNAGR